MRRPLLAALVLDVLVLAAATCAAGRAQTDAAPAGNGLASLLPAETVLFVECDDLRALVDATLALAHPLPAPAQLGQLALTAAVLATFGTTLHGAIADLAPAQVAFALVLPKDGRPVTVLLARVTDEARARARAARLANLGVYVGEGICALFPTPGDVERWRRFVPSDHPRLADEPALRAAPALPTPGLRAWFDVARLRRDRKLYDDLDPGGRFFFGPIATALARGNALHVALHVDAERLRVEADLDATAIGGEPAALLFAAGTAARRGLPSVPDSLAVFEVDRSLRNYLQHLDALLPEPVATRVRGEAANLDLIVGGGSFVDELLSGVAEPMHFVVVGAPVPTRRSDDATDDEAPPARPRVDLPGMALVAKVETERAEQLLNRGFYRFAAIFSAQRAQQQLPPRLPQVVREGDLRLHVMRGPAFPGVGDPPTGEQIEATLVFAHGHAVLATTPTCARQVVAALAAGAGEGTGGDALHGDVVRFRGAPIADYLRRNAGSMTLGRVLDEGETLAQARRFVDGIATAVALIDTFEVRIEPGAVRTLARLDVRRAWR